MIMYYVYVLFSYKLNKRYIGRTEDLKTRFAEHNGGNVTFTKRGMPWELIFYEAFSDKSLSIKEEKFLKTGKGRERLKWLLE